MISEIARIRRGKRDDGEHRRWETYKKAENQRRRTGSTSNRSSRSRTTAFQRISTRCLSGQHPPRNILLEPRATVARWASRVLQIVPITSTLRENYFRTGCNGTLATRNWSMSVSRIRCARSMGSNESAYVQHASAYSRVLLLKLYYDRLLSADRSSLYLTCRERRKWDCQQRDRINLWIIDWQPSTFFTIQSASFWIPRSFVRSVIPKSNRACWDACGDQDRAVISRREIVARFRLRRSGTFSNDVRFAHCNILPTRSLCRSSRRIRRRGLYFIYSAIRSTSPFRIRTFWINKGTILHHCC